MNRNRNRKPENAPEPETLGTPEAETLEGGYEVVQPLYGLDAPGVLRKPGYRFIGDPATRERDEQLVKKGYLKHA